METIEKLSKKKHLISEPYTDKDGNLIRIVDGKEIIQAEEKTQEDIDFNMRVNLWRMRK